MRYTLKDDGYPTFKKIMVGKKWVGRVGRHAEGGFVGTIGNETIRASTEVAAFEEISARHMGYPSAAALKARNAKTRAVGRAARSVGDEVARRMLAGDYSAFDAVMTRGPALMPAVFDGVARQLGLKRRAK
jgi:hypothetical protein